MRTFGMFTFVIFGGFLTFVGTLTLLSRTLGQFLLGVAILAAGVGALAIAIRLNRASRG